MRLALPVLLLDQALRQRLGQWKSCIYLHERTGDGGVPTKIHVLNILHRLLDGKPSNVPTIDALQALVLRQEPKADVERYDALRGKAVRHAS